MLGLIGKKIGMTQVFDDAGNMLPVTIVQVEPNLIVGERKKDRDGYDAVVLGAFDIKEKNVTKPYAGQFKDGMKPRKTCVEIRNFEKDYELGKELSVALFEGIQFVDVKGISKGKGYQGVVKRHGFAGGRKTHGSKFHRAPGSTGMAAWPSRVFKGTKMPGRMGSDNVTIQNLELVKIDPEKNILLIKGSVPGPKNRTVMVFKSKKKGNVVKAKEG
jgi:large subunit ribosomal protein L3